MLPNSFIFSEQDSRVDKDGNVYAGFISSIGSITLLLQTRFIKKSFQLEGDSKRLAYYPRKIVGQYGVVVEQEVEWKKDFKLDQFQLLKETDAVLIDSWLDDESKSQRLEEYYHE